MKLELGRRPTCFFCSNALIALARSLCKCLLAVLITGEADAVTGFLVRGASQYDTIPRREKKNTATKPKQASNKTTQKQNKQKQKHHKNQNITKWKVVRPTWFEDWKVFLGQEPNNPEDVFQPMHGLKLVIKEDVLPQEQLPQFSAVERLAETGLLTVDTWNSKREEVNFKATIEIPMLGAKLQPQESCDPGIGQHAARV